MPATLPKQERLSGKKAIGALMNGGKWGHTSHLRYCVLSGTGEPLNRIMVSVPKRNFKRAVKRNLLKRRLREAYRLQKDMLEGTGRDILFFYSSNEIVDSAQIRAEVASILKNVSAK